MSEQTGSYLIDRKSFSWSVNPLIALTREAISNTLMQGDIAGVPETVNELDIVMQSMLSLCYYKPEEVWEGEQRYIQDAAAQVPSDFQGKAYGNFKAHVDDASVRPNLDLIAPIVETHKERQATRGERLERAGEGLSAFIHGDIVRFNTSDPITTTKAREFHKEADGTSRMTVKEKHTDKRITMNRVSLETSRVCAEELHYVHKAREDEVIAFGAYVEGYDFPFAWVSYSPIGTEAERTIAAHTGREPERTLEMTRAWNAAWSPKNTMSVLFSYAHGQLQNMSKHQMLPNIEQSIGGVITAINPNLGFSGMAFSGVDFGVVGLKPTNHKFLLENGVPIYMLRRDIAKHLGVAITALAQNPQYNDSSMPLLHTNVMMVLFNKSARQKPDVPIFVVK